MKLAIALELLRIALRTELLKLLGVEDMVKRAFVEGYSMHADVDPNRIRNLGMAQDKVIWVTEATRCWRSVDEAWANSDAQEMFE